MTTFTLFHVQSPQSPPTDDLLMHLLNPQPSFTVHTHQLHLAIRVFHRIFDSDDQPERVRSPSRLPPSLTLLNLTSLYNVVNNCAVLQHDTDGYCCQSGNYSAVSDSVTIVLLIRKQRSIEIETRIPSGIWSRLYGSFPSALNTWSKV